MKTTMNLDEALVREEMAIHPGKTKTAVVELGLQELINAVACQVRFPGCGQTRQRA